MLFSLWHKRHIAKCFFKGCQPIRMEIKYIYIVSHISTCKLCVGIITNRAVNNFNVLMVLLRLAFFWSSQNNIFRWKELGAMSFHDSNKPVEHYERPLIVNKFARVTLSIYLSKTATLPPFTWVTINCKVVLFLVLNDGP